MQVRRFKRIVWPCNSSGTKPRARRTAGSGGFAFGFATLIFLGPTVEETDESMDYGELRIQAIGMADGKMLMVVYTDRGDVRRIISARTATPRERAQWHARQ